VPTTTDVLGWILVGAAASLAAMAWPFTRRARFATNLLLGGIGALVGALVAVALWRLPPRSGVCLGAAAAGSLTSLLLGHLVWIAMARRIARAHHDGDQFRHSRGGSVRGR